MVSLIIGNKGSGKTKRLIAMIDEAVENSAGTVVCIEKSPLLTYEVTHKARLIDTEHFSVQGCDAFYGMLCGILAQDHDVTEVFIDATLKIVGRDYNKFCGFIGKLQKLSEIADADFVLTVSEDEANLPAEMFAFAEKV